MLLCTYWSLSLFVGTWQEDTWENLVATERTKKTGLFFEFCLLNFCTWWSLFVLVGACLYLLVLVGTWQAWENQVARQGTMAYRLAYLSFVWFFLALFGSFLVIVGTCWY